MDKKAVSSSGFSCSVCTLCRPLRCKALKSRLWQKDAPCQRLYLYSDLLLGCAFTVCRGNDRPAAIRSAQAHLFCAAVNEVRLCSPDELTVLEVLAALVHSQQLCNGHAAHLADDIYIQPAIVGLCLLLVGCILWALFVAMDARFDRQTGATDRKETSEDDRFRFSDIFRVLGNRHFILISLLCVCLLYTSDAADE